MANFLTVEDSLQLAAGIFNEGRVWREFAVFDSHSRGVSSCKRVFGSSEAKGRGRIAQKSKNHRKLCPHDHAEHPVSRIFSLFQIRF
jgi:hypothetical protein